MSNLEIRYQIIVPLIKFRKGFDYCTMGVCNCPMFCCTLLYVPSSFAFILMGKRELVALLSGSS